LPHFATLIACCRRQQKVGSHPSGRLLGTSKIRFGSKPLFRLWSANGRYRRKGDTPHFDPELIADCDPSLGIETGQNPVPAERARFAEARFAPR